jgi:hypothetical protein
MRFLALLSLAISLCLSGCGAPGAPEPPSLGVPRPISDLQASRKGPKATLTWTAPTDTTDGELIRRPGKMIVARGFSPNGVFQPVADVGLEPALKPVQHPRGTATDDIGSIVTDPATPDFMWYHVTSVSNRGRSSPPSNNVTVPTVVTMPPPQNVTLSVVPRGVAISFEAPAQKPVLIRLNSQFFYRIKRRQIDGNAGAEPVLVSEIKMGDQTPSVVDTRIEWEKKYEYWVTPVTLWRTGAQQGEVEGDDTPAVAIAAHDIFPPAVPTGLQAVFSGLLDHPAVDLTWTPNTDEDLAGYNVYRRTEPGQRERINRELVKTPAFHDANVALGTKYFYSVSAVDLRGNESARSAEASESVPKM